MAYFFFSSMVVHGILKTNTKLFSCPGKFTAKTIQKVADGKECGRNKMDHEISVQTYFSVSVLLN